MLSNYLCIYPNDKSEGAQRTEGGPEVRTEWGIAARLEAGGCGGSMPDEAVDMGALFAQFRPCSFNRKMNRATGDTLNLAKT